jgi:hypothetical protein
VDVDVDVDVEVYVDVDVDVDVDVHVHVYVYVYVRVSHSMQRHNSRTVASPGWSDSPIGKHCCASQNTLGHSPNSAF